MNRFDAYTKRKYTEIESGIEDFNKHMIKVVHGSVPYRKSYLTETASN